MLHSGHTCSSYLLTSYIPPTPSAPAETLFDPRKLDPSYFATARLLRLEASRESLVLAFLVEH